MQLFANGYIYLRQGGYVFTYVSLLVNALPAALRDLAVTLGTLRQMLKSFLF